MTYPNIKSLLDWIAAFILSVIFAIPVLFLILITGLFKQARLGKGSRVFTVYKLRTMRPARVEDEPEQVRITRLGKILRKYSIDELPQLLNVLKGEMSLVGPRPLPLRYDSLISGKYRDRFLVKPGITGVVQVSGRNGLTWQERFELDRGYVKNLGLLTDLKILLLTFKAVIEIKGVDHIAETDPEFRGLDE